ncbi:MAG: hypothetical protein SPF51_09515 [Candidatus Fimivicinus sp.]|nr:hypothetical protein [Oscillospiraceae bacterium]MDY5591754.1 hypothetical protein [Candidatus Fimivicinus sp.]
MKKRIFTLFLSGLFLYVFLLPIQAESSNPMTDIKKFSYQASEYQGLSTLDIAEKKLSPFHISREMIQSLSEDQLDLIQKATEITAQSSYYVESPLFPGQMESVDAATYRVAAEKGKKSQKEEFDHISKQIQAKSALSDSVIISPGNSSKINGGTLNLVILMIAAGRDNYGVAGIFQWSTMPLFKGTDAFGLSRDVTTSIIPKTASGVYSYTYTMSYTQGTQYITQEKEDVHDVAYNALKRDNNGYGYAFEFKMPVSAVSLKPGEMSIHYTSVTGFVFFEGRVNNSSTTSVNHWATYAHKRYDLLFNSIDFSTPFGLGFSIPVGKSCYVQLTEEHIWII